MYSHGRTDIIETHLKGAISEASQETVAMLENQQSEMERYVDRLAIVREEKERRRQELWGRGDNLCCYFNNRNMCLYLCALWKVTFCDASQRNSSLFRVMRFVCHN